jgi:superoxide dismutase
MKMSTLSPVELTEPVEAFWNLVNWDSVNKYLENVK